MGTTTSQATAAFNRLKGMIEHCRDQQQRQGKPDAFVTFTIPGKWGSRTHAALFGRHGGPRGQILSDDFNRPGQIVVAFDADKVIESITRRLMELER